MEESSKKLKEGYSKELAIYIIKNSDLYEKFKEENDLILKILDIYNVEKILEVRASSEAQECSILLSAKERKILLQASEDITSNQKIIAFERVENNYSRYVYEPVGKEELIKLIPELIYIINNL